MNENGFTLQEFGESVFPVPGPQRSYGISFIAAILLALACIFAGDLWLRRTPSASSLDHFNVSGLYCLVIFVSIIAWRIRVILAATAISILLNLVAFRLSRPDIATTIDHMVGLVLQTVTGFLSYRIVLFQRNYQDEIQQALTRQRQLYLSERSAKEAERRALEESRLQAEQLKLTLQNERAARDERDYLRALAGEFQRHLLPPIPVRISDLCLGALYQPAIHEMHVGGDFYGVIDLGENRVGFFIGDVAGHGVAAAAYTAAVMATLRAFALEYPSEPLRAIERLNQTLTIDSVFDGFVSLFYGVYDSSDRTVRYINCGHEIPIVLSHNGEVRGLPSTGAVVGIFADSHFEERTETMMTGDAIVLLTDGITEARANGRGEFLQWERASAIANEYRHLLKTDSDVSSHGSQGLADIIFKLAQEHALSGEDGEGLTDDVALLVVHIHCPAE